MFDEEFQLLCVFFFSFLHKRHAVCRPTWTTCCIRALGQSHLRVIDRSLVAPKAVSFTLVPAGGVLCPNSSSLQEVRNCNEHACTVYHWQTGPWGQCTDDPSTSNTNASAAARPAGLGSCSTGIQTRKVICVRVSVGQVPPKK